jgi:DNA-binding GntR family transcriptional regulator
MKRGHRMRPDEIAALLRRAVRERVLPPGQMLNQDELARRFGVSRIPLREALRTLAGEGLVVMRPGIGAVVMELGHEEVAELYSLRLQLEPPLAPLIVDRCRPSDLAELEAILERMGAAGGFDPETTANSHYLFHRRLVELSGRPHTLRLLTQVFNLLEPYSRLFLDLAGPTRHGASVHTEMLESLRHKDASRLEERMRKGLLEASGLLHQSMDARDSDVDLAELLRPSKEGTG